MLARASHGRRASVCGGVQVVQGDPAGRRAGARAPSSYARYQAARCAAYLPRVLVLQQLQLLFHLAALGMHILLTSSLTDLVDE